MRYMCLNNIVIFLGLVAFVPHICLEIISVRGRCPRPHIKNGWVKMRSRGRIAKFNCIREYQLLGEKFATCLDGEWDNPPPLCVKPGCDALSLNNGQVMMTYRGAVVMFICNPGYLLLGPVKLYCDGRSWNGTAPECAAISGRPALSCDFEREDLCGWTQDPHHHFNWTRLNHNTPSGYVGTGPSHDHTLGKGKDGYYLYIEASVPRKQNDSARLYSPVYSPDEAAACFIFWYHMFGATVGSLAVYVKPDNMELTSDLEANFFQSGNKGDVWLKGVVDLPPTEVPFQIVIEGVRGPGYVGDTAIDDVRLANDSECYESTTDVTPNSTYITDEVPSEVPDELHSCRLRCTRQFSGTTESMISPSCDCHSFCKLSNTCCEDYSIYCTADEGTTASTTTVKSTKPSRTYPPPPPLPPLEPHPLESSLSPITTTQTSSWFKPIPIPPDPTPLVIVLPTRRTTTSTTTTLATITTRRSTTITKPTTIRTTTIKQATTSKAPTIINATTVKTMPTTIKAIAATTKKATTAAKTKPTATLKKETTAAATTATTSRRTYLFVPVTRSTLTPSVHSTTNAVTSSKPQTSTERSIIKTSLIATTTTPRQTITAWRATKSAYWENEVQGKEWRAAPRGPVVRSEEPVPISLIAGISVLIAAVLIVSVIAFIFIRHRRKSRSQQNLAEDSDVRFLTADEILDFTLARPREDDDDF